ncbi:unnamed protein product [Urochloa humidicola]
MDGSGFRPSFDGSWLTTMVLLLAAATLGGGSAASCPVEQDGMMPGGATTGTKLPVVHRDGPCSSPLPDENGKVMSHAEILAADQRRVQYIQRRAIETAAAAVPPSSSSSGMPYDEPSSPGDTLDTGYYVVPIGLGTPMQRFTVALDTGSDMTWVQCRPCKKCYHQKEPVFSPANSSTYAGIQCSSPNCPFRNTKSCSRDHYCPFQVDYIDDSHSYGNYVYDTLAIGKDTITDFGFGCSHDIWGLFGQSAGVLGLGRGKTSLMVQAQSKYGGVFSYCLPADPNGIGFLDLGHGAAAAAAKARQTPMLTNKGPTHYYVQMTGIKVGGHLLPINESVFSTTAGMIMDSGTVITRLPPSAYGPLRSAFVGYMEVLGYKKGPTFSLFDTCYNLTGLQGVIPVPTVALLFQGGATLDVDASGILYVANVSNACLAFTSSRWDTEIALIGSTQQKTYAVLYDVVRKVVGFTPGAC